MKYYVYIIQEVYKTVPWHQVEGNGQLSKNMKKKMNKMPCKIGVSSNVENRINQLQTGNSKEITLVAKIGPLGKKEAFSKEKMLHRKLRRFRLNGEWYNGRCLKYFGRAL